MHSASVGSAQAAQAEQTLKLRKSTLGVFTSIVGMISKFSVGRGTTQKTKWTCVDDPVIHSFAKAYQRVLQLSLNVGLHSRHDITLEALPDSSTMRSASLAMQKLETLWRVGVAHHGGTQDKRDRGQVDVYSSGRQGVRVRPQG